MDYGKRVDLSVSVGEQEVFLDTDVEPDKGFSLSPDEAEQLAGELMEAAKNARTMRYGN